MKTIKISSISRLLLTRKVRLSNLSKRSTLNGVVTASVVASPLKGARFFGISAGSNPAKSSII